MTAFAPLLNLLADVPDPRRAQGKLYQLQHVLLFAILAIVSGANSYRGIVTFIDVNREELNSTFHLNWLRAPAHTAIRYILKGLDRNALEATFRGHAALLQAACAKGSQVCLAIDGKTLRGSFDHFRDRLAAQILSVFATETALVLAHLDIDEKSNEIPAAQAVLAALGIPAAVVTLDALHCQKKTFEAGAAANATLVVQVKDNQPSLHQQVQDISATATPFSQVSSHDKGRGRDEKRTVTVFDPAKALAGSEWQSHVTTVIRVSGASAPHCATRGVWCQMSSLAEDDGMVDRASNVGDAPTSDHMSARAQGTELATWGKRRRRWTAEQKRQIVAESMEPGASAATVACRHGITSGQFYAWRQQLLLDGALGAAAASTLSLVRDDVTTTVLLQTQLESRAWACGGVWSGGALEQFSDEGCLSLHVAAADLPNLSLPHHRHRLVASQGSSGGSEAAKAEPRPGQAFDPPVVLFGDVVQVLALSQPGPRPQCAGALHLGNGLRIGGVLVDGDRAGVHRVWLAQRLAEEPLRRRGVPPGRKQEVNGLAAAVDRSIQVGPAALDLDVGLIDPPRAIA